MGILLDMRRGTICFDKDFTGRVQVIAPHDDAVHSEQDAEQLGEFYIRMLGAPKAATLFLQARSHPAVALHANSRFLARLRRSSE
jgi:hypothetical protein